MFTDEARSAAVETLRKYAAGLKKVFSGDFDAQPEDQLKAPVAELLTEYVRILGISDDFVVRTEVSVEDIAGRPDLGLSIGLLHAGNVELKAPGTGAAAHRYRGRNAEQFKRFAQLPNVVYTDGRDWCLYRDEGILTTRVTLSFDPTTEGAGAVTEDDANELLAFVAQFLKWEPSAPRNAKALAELLAPLTRFLRDDVLADVAADGPLATLAADWRRVFYPEASDHAFADAYAQTLTYAMLLARLEGAQAPLTAGAAADYLQADHSLLAQVLRVVSQPEARTAIGMPVEVIERVISAVNPSTLRREGRDPWLYFYEDFLAAYDPAQRNSRGVYYTPIPVVQAQVRLVDHTLRGTFGKIQGIGSADVTVLDPAAGTGTYVLQVFDHILDQVERDQGEGMRTEAAVRLVPNIFAFELLVGPYAVAHLRLHQAFDEAGVPMPPPNGLGLRLTDTLSAPVGTGHVDAVPLFERPLAEEQVRASTVKQTTRIVCCLGNPPYDRDTSGEIPGARRKGGIVRYNEDGSGPGLLGDYLDRLPVRVRASHSLNLYNDYIYFWRWGTWKALEQHPETGGIVSYITASSYLLGPGHGGMREHLRRLCDEIWIIDLGGEGRGTTQEENVFDIRTPVAIAIAIRLPGEGPLLRDQPAIVRYRRIHGTRDEKYSALDALTDLDPTSDAWSQTPSGWQEPFVPPGEGDFFDWPSLADIVPWMARGIQFSRTWPIAETADTCMSRWRKLLDGATRHRRNALKETGDTKVDRIYGSFLSSGRLAPISALGPDDVPDSIEKFCFRSFDVQWCIADRRVIDRPRPPLWHVRSDRQVYLTTLTDQPVTAGPAVSAHAYVPDLNATVGSNGGLVAPLWRDSEALAPNISSGVLDRLTSTFGHAVSAEDVLAYLYGLVGTEAYAIRFADVLAMSGVHIPITANQDVFAEVVNLGRELLWWHTYGERFVPSGESPGHLPAGEARCTISVGTDLPSDYFFDSSAQVLRVGEGRFEPVEPAVWNFEVSGLHVLGSWLDYRKAQRIGRRSSPLDEIRPEAWQHSEELLKLLWILERTVALTPVAAELLDQVVAGPVIVDIPGPTDAERQAPGTSAALRLDVD